jgi:hypothetical protein
MTSSFWCGLNDTVGANQGWAQCGFLLTRINLAGNSKVQEIKVAAYLETGLTNNGIQHHKYHAALGGHKSPGPNQLAPINLWTLTPENSFRQIDVDFIMVKYYHDEEIGQESEESSDESSEEGSDESSEEGSDERNRWHLILRFNQPKSLFYATSLSAPQRGTPADLNFDQQSRRIFNQLRPEELQFECEMTQSVSALPGTNSNPFEISDVQVCWDTVPTTALPGRQSKAADRFAHADTKLRWHFIKLGAPSPPTPPQTALPPIRQLSGGGTPTAPEYTPANSPCLHWHMRVDDSKIELWDDREWYFAPPFGTANQW